MEIEKAVLGGFFVLDNYDEQINYYLDLKAEYFTDVNSNHRNYYNAIGSVLMNKKIVDMLCVYNLCKNEYWFNPAELSGLSDAVSSSANMKYHIAILKERNYKKRIEILINKELSELKKCENADDTESLKDRLIANLSGIELEIGSKFEDLKKYEKLIKENITSNKPIEGYAWGHNEVGKTLTSIDNYTSGIMKPRMIIVGGLKKSGKTRFLINTRKSLYHQNIVTPFISMEMPGYEVTKLTMSAFSDVNDIMLRSNTFLNSEQKGKLLNMKINYDLMPTECSSGLDKFQILSRIRKYAKLYPGCVVMIDYLQRIKHDRNRQAFELEEISNMIADATRTYNVTVILLSQLSNASEDNIPSVGHLKGSGGIGESADIILLIDNVFRRTKRDSDRNKTDIYIEQRYGDAGKVELYSDLGICLYKDPTAFDNINNNYYNREE